MKKKTPTLPWYFTVIGIAFAFLIIWNVFTGKSEPTRKDKKDNAGAHKPPGETPPTPPDEEAPAQPEVKKGPSITQVGLSNTLYLAPPREKTAAQDGDPYTAGKDYWSDLVDISEWHVDLDYEVPILVLINEGADTERVVEIDSRERFWVVKEKDNDGKPQDVRKPITGLRDGGPVNTLRFMGMDKTKVVKILFSPKHQAH